MVQGAKKGTPSLLQEKPNSPGTAKFDYGMLADIANRLSLGKEPKAYC